MRLQSTIEFLTVYGFAILVISTALVIVFAIVTSSPNIKTGCSSFGSIACNYVNYFSPKGSGYSVVTLSITNSQGAPFNDIGFSVSLLEKNYTGICTPNMLYPGQEATCAANITRGVQSGVTNYGYFTVNGLYCNSYSGTPTLNCSSPVSFGGQFDSYTSPAPVSIFSAVAGSGNSTTQLAPYSSTPQLPSSYQISQYGVWTAKTNSTAIAYAFGTTGYTGNYYGVAVSQFPGSLSALNNNAIPCSAPYGSTYSLAYTTIYLTANTALTFNAVSYNGIAIYYAPQGGSWSGVNLGPGASTTWSASSVSNSVSTVTLQKGLNSIAVAWTNTCAKGVQAVQISGNTV